MGKKLKSWLENEQLFMTLLIVLVSCASFALGRQSVKNVALDRSMEPAITIQSNAFLPATAIVGEGDMTPPGLVSETNSPQYVVSKSGTKYHHISCPGAKQMKDSNKVFFATPGEAEAAGYSRAANCDR